MENFGLINLLTYASLFGKMRKTICIFFIWDIVVLTSCVILTIAVDGVLVCTHPSWMKISPHIVVCNVQRAALVADFGAQTSRDRGRTTPWPITNADIGASARDLRRGIMRTMGIAIDIFNTQAFAKSSAGIKVKRPIRRCTHQIFQVGVCKV